jgi:hypothetical protein
MLRQLEKTNALVRLIVQKMEIPAEMEIDDASKCDKNENSMKMQKFRRTLNVARRFSRLQSSTNNKPPHFFEQNEKS